MNNNIVSIRACCLFFLLIIGAFNSKAQSNYEIINSRLVEIKSKELLNELDSVLNFEKKCNYFNDSILFNIDIVQEKNFKEIKIGSVDNCFFSDLGYSFIYKNCLFQIFSDSSHLDSNLYIVTKYWMHYTINADKLIRESGANDDSRGVFDYEYKDGIFYRKNAFFCD